MTDNRPIGIFDSGVGGLSVWRQIVTRMPHESTLYVADSTNCPYGPKSVADVVALSMGITEFLLASGAKAIVVACNTASAAALAELRTKFDVPFIGMEPAIKPAARATRTGHVGVLATAGTLRGDLYHHTRDAHAGGVAVHQQVAHGLVDLVEHGELDGTRVEGLLTEYLSPLIAKNIDQLVLGCTHYPFLANKIRAFVGNDVALIDPADAVARQVSRVLENGTAQATDTSAQHRFFSTGDATAMHHIFAHIGFSAPPVTILRWTGGKLRE